MEFFNRRGYPVNQQKTAIKASSARHDKNSRH
jgi:hypothetical protein